MRSPTILTVVGARPQFIKASAVSRAIAACPRLKEVLVHSGQHADPAMSDIFFRELGISAPLYHLGVSGGTAGAMVGEMLPKLEALMLSIQPDAVLVYGDTNTTLAGALAAAQTGIPLFHVEAGLRSGNMRTPEEVNRVITDRLSALLLCPTQRAVTNLEAEGIVHNVFHVGDVMYDVSISTGAVASRQSLVGFDGLRPGEYAVATLHRAENVEDASRLELLLAYLEEQARIVPIVTCPLPDPSF